MSVATRREGRPSVPKGRWSSRVPRLEVLIALARLRAGSLRREMFAAPRESETRDLARRRLARVERRIRRLRALARLARRPSPGLATC
jgi:hypothetical protein